MLIIRIGSPSRVFRLDFGSSGKLTTPIAKLPGGRAEGVNLEDVDQRIKTAITAIGSTSQAEITIDVLIGQALSLLPNGRLSLAIANSIGTAKVCGLALSDGSVGTAVSYSPDGIATREDWLSVAGTVDLVPGSIYYLSPDQAGNITAIAPEQPGQIVAPIGTALTARSLAIELQPFILL